MNRWTATSPFCGKNTIICVVTSVKCKLLSETRSGPLGEEAIKLKPEESNANKESSLEKVRSWFGISAGFAAQIKKKYLSKKFAIFLHRFFKRIIRSLSKDSSKPFLASIAGAVAETIQEKSATVILGKDEEKLMLLPKTRRDVLDKVIKACEKTRFHSARLNYQGVNAYLYLFYNETQSKSNKSEAWKGLGCLIDENNLALYHSTGKQGGDVWSMYEICFANQGKEAESRAFFQTTGPEVWEDARSFIIRAGVLAGLIACLGFEFLMLIIIALTGLAFIFEKEERKLKEQKSSKTR